jgi:hypothetical protein
MWWFAIADIKKPAVGRLSHTNNKKGGLSPLFMSNKNNNIDIYQ